MAHTNKGTVTAQIPHQPHPRPQASRSNAGVTVGASGEPAASSTGYAVETESAHGGAATIAARATTIAFDGSASTGELLPGPADLLAAALAACILKNVERFSTILPFHYQRARVQVEIEREEPPPRIVRAHYALRIVTDEPEHRLGLLHRNILRFGTITNTLAAACELEGTILAEPSTASDQDPGEVLRRANVSTVPGSAAGSTRSRFASGAVPPFARPRTRHALLANPDRGHQPDAEGRAAHARDPLRPVPATHDTAAGHRLSELHR
jgi:uncharacterized OsmC-like protein